MKENLGLDKYSDKLAKHLSGGTKRKLTFALAMAMEPRLLLLDEPTCGLDPISRRQLFQFLKSQAWRTSTMIITQSLEDVEEACDKVYVMSNGQVLHKGTPR